MKKLLFLCNSNHAYNDIMAVINDMENIYAGIYKVGADFSQVQAMINQINPSAIIALPVTKEYIEPYVTCPVIALVPSQLDLLFAMNAAKSVESERIYYIGYQHSMLETERIQIEQILKRKITLITYRSIKERQKVMERVSYETKIKLAVVTSYAVKEQLMHMGINCVLLRWSASSVQHAINKAYDVINSSEQEIQRNEWLMQMLDSIQAGIIGINSDVITEFNCSASTIFDTSSASVLGLELSSLSPKSALHKFLQQISHAKEKELLVNIKGKLYLATEIIVNSRQRMITLKGNNDIHQLQANFRREANRQGMLAKYHFSDIIGTCAETQHCLALARRYAENDATVLILGDTGTGKELFAQSIHNASPRASGPFVAVNCAAVPENILESELFGYEGGSFTGAKKDGKPGLFEIANNGTLFLDEIGDMPLQLQSKILRVLQNKEIMHLGGTVMIPIDVRIITATNRNLEQAIQQNEFRKDLYYRLSTLTLHVPSLKERTADIPKLVEHFYKQQTEKYQKFVPPPSPVALRFLQEKEWPGNIRELEMLIERYVILWDKDSNPEMIDYWRASKERKVVEAPQHIRLKLDTLQNMEYELLQTLSKHYSDKEMSEILQISRSTIWRKLKNIKS